MRGLPAELLGAVVKAIVSVAASLAASYFLENLFLFLALALRSLFAFALHSL
jgi:hypothetical protein